MKALKNFSGIFLLTVLFILAGCSDLITPNEVLKENNFGISVKKYDKITYTSKYRINPGICIFLDSTVTSMKYIFSYSISNCNLVKKQLFISASNMDQYGSLPCSVDESENYLLYDLSIENTCNQPVTIDVCINGISIDE